MNYYKITKPVRLIELFGGIGSQALALKLAHIPFEHHALVEIDQHAVDSYNAIHGTNFETKDIRHTHAVEFDLWNHSYTNIMTYSFPCTDLSLVGKRRGMEKGSNTNSSLLWEVERILKETKSLPEVLIMENVPSVIGMKNVDSFRRWRDFLNSLGYRNFVKLLNAKDYGIPQNRKRCFMVSILGDYDYEFPRPIPLKLKMKYLLDKDVDEKYYLSPKLISFFEKNSKEQEAKGNGFRFAPRPIDECDIAKTITTRSGWRMEGDYIIDGRGIRKLTPRESWALMGFPDFLFEKAKKVNSDSQLYKQAGNSIVVDVLQAIFEEMKP